MKVEELKKKLKKMRHEYSVAKEIDKLLESKKTAIYKAKKSILEEIIITVEPMYIKIIEQRKKVEDLKSKLIEEARAVPDTEDGPGLKELRESAEDDLKRGNNHAGPLEKIEWIIERAKHYQLKTGKPYQEIIDTWVSKKNYWYINYFQEANQPLITGEDVYLFENIEEAKESFKELGFRCHRCGGISKSPKECDTNIVIDKKTCDWKAYGLFGTLGKGVTIILKDTISIENIFKPIAYEKEGESDD